MNLVYHTLTRNMGEAEKRQFDLKLLPERLKEREIDRQNAEAMKLITGGMDPTRKPTPLPHRKRKK